MWLRAADGVRLRAAHWSAQPPQGRARGTVVVLPGRTEYIEKYGEAVAALRAGGWAVLVIDWRGQGLSDRALADPMAGHVGAMAEFQRDLAALLAHAAAAGLPRPIMMLAHSMGGAIGLRHLLDTPESGFAAAAFSAPMWGIRLPALAAPLVPALARLFARAGGGEMRAPMTGALPYVLGAGFAGNVLTRDAAMWGRMIGHLAARPALGLAGPTLGWLAAGLAEGAALATLPSPALPALCALGSNERVVDPGAIRRRMALWPGGRLLEVEGGEHEVLMGRPEERGAFLAQCLDLFAGAAQGLDGA